MANYTLQERIDKCRALRSEGYNCAQSVIMAFDDLTGLSEEVAAKLTSALGSGVAGMGEMCGVANAMALVVGMRHGSSASDKVAATKECKPLIEQFKEMNHGRLTCRELKGKADIRPCNDLVALGVELLHNHFSKT